LHERGVELPPKRMAVDIFPALNLPVIYVCQPYGGMDPAQMEGLLTNYYEYHFLYINGIHHVESRNVQGAALMKLQFHSGTNMAQAMAETINYVNRSRAMMPPGTVPPFVMRFDTGSVPVGYLVLSSGTKTIAEIQDQALFKVRPMFSSLPGVSAPPPFGGSARSIVIRANPDRLRAYGISPDEVISALTTGNTIRPSGNFHLFEFFPWRSCRSCYRRPRRRSWRIRCQVAIRLPQTDGQTTSVGFDERVSRNLSKQLVELSLSLDQQLASFVRDSVVLSSLSRDNNVFAGKVPTSLKVMENRIERSGAQFVSVVLQFFDHAHPANGFFFCVVQDMQPHKSSEEMLEQLGVVHCIDIRY